MNNYCKTIKRLKLKISGSMLEDGWSSVEDHRCYGRRP